MTIEDVGSMLRNEFGVNLSDPDLGGAVDPADEAAFMADDLGAVLKATFPNASRAAMGGVQNAIDQKVKALEGYYAGAFALYATRLRNTPNACVGLFGNDNTAGKTWASGTAVTLQPRLAGTTTGADFAFSAHMTFYRVVTSLLDTANGWCISGGSFKFADDPIAGLQNDASFAIFETDVDFDRTPLGVYARRTFTSPVNLSCAAIHKRAAAQELVCGVNIEYRDSRCRISDTAMGPAADGTSYGDLVRSLIAKRAQNMGRVRSFPSLSVAPSGGRPLY